MDISSQNVFKMTLIQFYKEKNNNFRRYLLNKKILSSLEITQISISFFAICYSFIFFIYFYLRINKILSLVFIFSFILGVLILYSTKKGVVNDTIRKKETFIP